MANNLEVSMSVKYASGKIPFAAVEYKDNQETKTVIYRSSQKHLNEMFVDVLNFAVLKEVLNKIDNYDAIVMNLDKNKYSRMIRDGSDPSSLNEKEIHVIQKTMSMYNKFLNITEKKPFHPNFEHANVDHLYNDTLNSEKLKSLLDTKIGMAFGDLFIVDEKIEPTVGLKQQAPIKTQVNTNSENINAFIDIIESDKTKDRYYVGVALSKKIDGEQKTLISKIIPVSHNTKEEALEEQISKAFFKGENKRQNSYLYNMIENEKGLNVFCSPEIKETVSKMMGDIFSDQDFDLKISDRVGDNIKTKLQNRVMEDEKLLSLDTNDLKSNMIASEIYQNDKNMAIYISGSAREEGQTFGAVVRAPNSDSVLFEIEGRVSNDISNDIFHIEKEAVFETLNYLGSKVRNGHLPNNIDLEIRSSNLFLMSAFKEGRLLEEDQKRLANIKKSLPSNINYAWLNEQHLDPYMRCAKDNSKSAKKLLNKSILMNIDFKNDDLLNALKHNEEYKYTEKKKPKKKIS